MQSIAVIDNVDPEEVAVWIVSRTSAQRASNTNAVTLRRSVDPAADEKLRSLTRNNAIVLTEDSTVTDLPATARPLPLTALLAFAREIIDAQRRIVEASKEMGARPPSGLPQVPDHLPEHDGDSPQQRALRTANFVGHLWSAWLATEEERRSRSTRYEGPGVPEVFQHQGFAVLPLGFVEAAKVQIQG